MSTLYMYMYINREKGLMSTLSIHANLSRTFRIPDTGSKDHVDTVYVHVDTVYVYVDTVDTRLIQY